MNAADLVTVAWIALTVVTIFAAAQSLASSWVNTAGTLLRSPLRSVGRRPLVGEAETRRADDSGAFRQDRAEARGRA